MNINFFGSVANNYKIELLNLIFQDILIRTLYAKTFVFE